MSINTYPEKFIEQVVALILEHLSDAQFGVSELADLMHMSRSNLLRKIKKQTGRSASQFIREVRLKKSQEMLDETELSISEISFQVGFSSNSYFIKCFKDLYGFSPGESRKETKIEITDSITSQKSTTNKSETNNPLNWNRKQLQSIAAVLLVLVTVILIFSRQEVSRKNEIISAQKSIAVLPFKNMSSDSNNLYFVNGLMESTLNNLQKIQDLRVISRTSVEKYRTTDKSVKEIAEELNVKYLVEGSGQLYGKQVVLHIQLIDATNDTQVWSKQYNRKMLDIFSLQNEVATKITEAIKVTVTPEEQKQIDKQPTENLVAYDFYLKGLEVFKKETEQGLKSAIVLFEKALEEDTEFALAHAKIALAYYYLDLNKIEKKHVDQLNNNADKALLYDATATESLIAKALYYISEGDFKLAIPHLDKALEYNPNSNAVVQLLADMYGRVIPDTGKYLQYALKGLQLSSEANDSIQKSYMYLALSNAFIQNGFTKEAEKYLKLSLDNNSENYYAPYLKVFIHYAKDQNITKATANLVSEWKKDMTRMDILQEVGKFYYFQEKYDSAFYYYKKFVQLKEKKKLYVYPQENLKIGIVYEKMGKIEAAQDFYKTYATYCEKDTSIYQSISLAMLYLQQQKPKLAMEKFQLFATQNNYQYWVLLFFEIDPLMKLLKDQPTYDLLHEKIEKKFWNNHHRLKKSLKEKRLL